MGKGLMCSFSFQELGSARGRAYCSRDIYTLSACNAPGKLVYPVQFPYSFHHPQSPEDCHSSTSLAANSRGVEHWLPLLAHLQRNYRMNLRS